MLELFLLKCKGVNVVAARVTKAQRSVGWVEAHRATNNAVHALRHAIEAGWIKAVTPDLPFVR